MNYFLPIITTLLISTVFGDPLINFEPEDSESLHFCFSKSFLTCQKVISFIKYSQPVVLPSVARDFRYDKYINKIYPDLTLPCLIWPNQTKPNQTKPNQTKPNQTKPNQTKQNQTKQNKTKQNKTKPNLNFYLPLSF